MESTTFYVPGTISDFIIDNYYKESQEWRDLTKNEFDSTPESDLKFGLSNWATYNTIFK